MRHQTIASFAALMVLALIAGGSLAIIARQSDGDEPAATGASGDGFEGYTLTGTIGGPLIPTAPVDVAVSEDGRIFIADIGLNRVLAFTPGGELDTSWSEDGMSERLIFPAGLAIGPDGSLYVLQLGNAEVHVFDEDGEAGATWAVGDSGGMPGVGIPTAIGIDSDGTVYVPDQRSQQIRRFSPDGDEMESWPLPLGELDANEIWPRDIIEWDGRMLMSYQNAAGNGGGLIAFDAGGGSEVVSDPLTRTPATGDYAPAGIAIGPEGRIAVLYLSGDEAEPPFIGTTDGGWEPADVPSMVAINGLILPGIAWEPNGLLLVADPARQRVRMFRANGSVAGDIQSATDEGRFAGLDEITIGPDGYLYAADPLLGRVTALGPDGSILTQSQLPDNPEVPLTTGFTRQRMRMAVDSAGAVYVADEFTGQITKFRQDGEVVTTDWIASDDPEAPFIAMMLAAGDEDRLYAVNIESQDQINVFSADGEALGPLAESFGEGAIQDITVSGDTIYAVELGVGTSLIRSFSIDGDERDELANLSSGGGNSNRTGFALAADPDGGLLVAAVNVASGPEFEYQLLRMDPDGDLHRLGTLDIPFTTLPDIAVDGAGTLYVAAPNDQVVYVYDPDP